MKYSLRSLMIATIIVPLLLGCDPYHPRSVKKIQKGIENVDKRAKEIEKAAQPKPSP